MSDKNSIPDLSKSFWQSDIWSEILTKTGQADVIFLPHNGEEILIERRKIWGKYSGLYILGVNSTFFDETFFDDIRKNIATKYDLFLQIEPYFTKEKIKNKKEEMWNIYKKNPPFLSLISSLFFCEEAPFRRFLEPVTAIIDLMPPGHVSAEVLTKEEGGKGQQEGNKGVGIEEILLASFSEKGRYNIRLAEKRGVTTRWVKASEACNTKYNLLRGSYGGQEIQNTEGKKKDALCPPDKGGEGGLNRDDQRSYIELFYDLLDETTKRDGFAHNSLSYYTHFVETLEQHNAGGLLIAEKDGILHAAGIFVYTNTPPHPNTPLPFPSPSKERGQGGGFREDGVGIYYYGASSSDKEIRRDMATYLLQWEAIKEARRRGCESYDFLGISDDGTGKLAGVTEFKMRFNPEKIYLPEEVVVVYKPLLLKILQITRKIKRIFTSSIL